MPAYFGSTNILTSTANQEIIQQHKPSGWTITIEAYKFEFKSLQDCHIKINDGASIFFEAGYEFIVDISDISVYKFVIVESGIQYKYFGTYR